MQVELLGPLRLIVGGVPEEVRGPKRRAVLALLAFAEGRTVSVDHLLNALWPSEVPESGRQAVHTHVSRLRAHLGPAADRLTTQQDGYRLTLRTDDLDLARARSLLASARPRVDGDPAGASALLREAYALWRGPVLADLVDVEPIAAAVQACAQLYRDVADTLVSAAVGAGRAQEVLDIAAESLAADPLRESAVLLQMRALAGVGRAPEALRTGREYRQRLAEETGLDPSSALGDLERDVAGGAAGPPATPPARPARATTRLFGRAADVESVHRLLATERLVTVVGPGGVGKSRLAMETVGTDNAVSVLLLAPVTDPAAVPHALAAALNLTVTHGDVLAACLAVLGDRRGLLVIDNCEHLLDAVRDMVAVLLPACPGITVLATSREPLGLPAEHTSRLAPLALPRPGEDLAQAPAVAVFLDRAARVRPGPTPSDADLGLIADIARRLDGMPLAIELAAGRLSTFSLADLHRRLDRSLDLLGGTRPSGDDRQRTLRATVEWSYELLSDDEQRLFRALSVFVDGVGLDTAERLAADLGLAGDPGSILARLVDASMIDADVEAGTRFRMLETLRAFGLDRLAATGEDETAARHLLGWAVTWTAWFADTASTDAEADADAALRRERANLRAAWRLARRRGSLDATTAMITGLFDAVAYRDLVEIRGWAEELVDDPELPSHPREGAVLGVAAEAAYHRGDHARADRFARAGLERATDGVGRWMCLSVLSVADLARGAFTDVVENSVAAAALAGPSRENLGVAALAATYNGDLDRARTLNDQGLAAAVSPSMLAWGAYVAGEIESSAGQDEPAEAHYTRAIDLARTSGATFLVGVATVGLLALRAGTGRMRDALHGYLDVIGYFERTGNWTHQWTTLRNLADLLRRVGDPEPAALLDAAADRAPDAPAVVGPPAAARREPDTAVPGRDAVLDLARQAIERNLARS